MNRLMLSLLGLLLLIPSWSEAGILPTRLTCENLNNPQVVDIVKPRLSWVNIAGEGERGQVQTAWEIRAAGTREKLLNGQPDLWNSGKVNSNQSVNVIYGGKALTSRQDCWWQVRTWDKSGNVSEWSEPAFWSMGLLNPEEWKAQCTSLRAPRRTGDTSPVPHGRNAAGECVQ